MASDADHLKIASSSRSDGSQRRPTRHEGCAAGAEIGHDFIERVTFVIGKDHIRVICHTFDSGRQAFARSARRKSIGDRAEALLQITPVTQGRDARTATRWPAKIDETVNGSFDQDCRPFPSAAPLIVSDRYTCTTPRVAGASFSFIG